MAEAGDAFLGPSQQNILRNEVMFALLFPLELPHGARQGFLFAFEWVSNGELEGPKFLVHCYRPKGRKNVHEIWEKELHKWIHNKEVFFAGPHLTLCNYSSPCLAMVLGCSSASCESI